MDPSASDHYIRKNAVAPMKSGGRSPCCFSRWAKTAGQKGTYGTAPPLFSFSVLSGRGFSGAAAQKRCFSYLFPRGMNLLSRMKVLKKIFELPKQQRTGVRQKPDVRSSMNALSRADTGAALDGGCASARKTGLRCAGARLLSVIPRWRWCEALPPCGRPSWALQSSARRIRTCTSLLRALRRPRRRCADWNRCSVPDG